jgi:prepilin-type N-terminal cleavage/methylation domain-containing protein/prepilin-type processing-associated H-X9-DG protein
MRLRGNTSQSRGFTLIELLVAIAIIAILAAMLFPVFAKARDKARQVSCLSNLRQLGCAVMTYVQDYDEFFPPSGIFQAPRWDARLMPYVKNQGVYKCPGHWLNASVSTYAANGLVFAPGNVFRPPPLWPDTPVAVSGVVRPAQVLLLFDVNTEATRLIGDANVYPCVRVAAKGRPDPGWEDNTFLQYHIEGDNITFCDGHVKWYPTKDIFNCYQGTTFYITTFRDISFDVGFDG